ncbi:uncharacterized protein LOC125230721 [Leguminivora glycinivorella]|uniref:uncharacterized protein LOC125230721 n=1 Tax=Leguminivora glycinivorella TaxID=1035111 RepID=UPI00200CA304|nr:uncharacterized protein LOC125230721 [Leguminivora glycinivorella]
MRLSKRLDGLEKKLAKYRMRLLRLKRKKDDKTENRREAIRKQITEFLLDDENSRLTAGKKETITRRQVKKQIRLLNDSLFNLHKTFLNKTGVIVSYETFRRCRPFWVVLPKAASRNTCLCALHANNDFIAQALHKAKILPYSSATDVAKSLCCNKILSVSCLERKCLQCRSKDIDIDSTDLSDTIIYQRWITKNVTVTTRGQEKQCKKTIKETVRTTQRLLIQVFRSNLPKFMQHLANIINQFKAVRFIKHNMSPSEGLLHIDFSENYGCKYGEEVQSAHFGGSKAQLSLHTCVYYSSDSHPPENRVKATSFCTVSENLRHDPVLICAHLKPVIEKMKSLTPALSFLHILSDGPSTQYRNKTMFFMIAKYISKISQADTIIWHFSEAGHGKGAPDGVGGCIKRVCDNAVANGKDITGIDGFFECLKHNIKNINIIRIDDEFVDEIQQLAAACKLRPFRGTFQIHQIAWSKIKPDLLQARRLSCITCPAYVECPHYKLGQIIMPSVTSLRTQSTRAHSEQLNYVPDLSNSAASSPVRYSFDSTGHVSSGHSYPPRPASSNSDPPRPASSNSNPPSPASSNSHPPRPTPSPLTPDASTVTGPRTPPTPEPPTHIPEPLTPRKRPYFRNTFCDDSDLAPKKIKKNIATLNIDDDSDEDIF